MTAVTSRQTIRSYRDIEAFQRAMALLAPLHALIRRLPREERWELASQLRRASKSVVANIAEGYARRRSANHFRTYLETALGSANEVIVHLEIAVAVGYCTSEDVAPLIDGYEIVGKQLFRLGENWRSFEDRSPRRDTS
jgi:four helix bundle protein